MLFNKKNDEDPIPTIPTNYRKPDGTPTRSVIDPWLQITGNLEGDGELQIDGLIRGDIRCSQLVVGKDATVDGNITADQVVVRGKVNGVIRGNRVILQEGALVQSEIFHRRLSIEEGALFNGTIHMRDNPIDELLAVAAEMKSATKAKSSVNTDTSTAGQAMAATEMAADAPANSMAPLIGSEMKHIRAQLRERRPA